MAPDPFGNPASRGYQPPVTGSTFYWPDNFKLENLVWRLPRNVRWNDNVVVREDEWALFMRDGKVLYRFDTPGRYALTTQSIPLVATAVRAVTGVEQIGEVYWLQKREFRTEFSAEDALTFRDVDFGLVRLITSGQYAFRITDPIVFVTEFLGTKGIQHVDRVADWLNNQILTVLNTVLGQLKQQRSLGVIDMPALLPEIEQLCLGRLASETEPYGMKVMKFSGLVIRLPAVVQEAIDKRSALSALGVNYMQYQAGEALGDIGTGAARGGDGGGFAGIGAGLGAGVALGQTFTQSFATQAPAPTVPARSCPHCQSPVPERVKFCPECGKSMQKICPGCQAQAPPTAKFCPDCGVPFQ